MGKALVKIGIPVSDLAKISHSHTSGESGIEPLHDVINVQRQLVLGEYFDLMILCMELTRTSSNE